MKLIRILVVVALSSVLATAPALASNAGTFTVSFNVPLQCDVMVLGSTVEEKRVTIDVSRSCNARHALVVTGGAIDGLGSVSIGEGRAVRLGTDATFLHSEQFVPNMEQIVFDCPDAFPGSTMRFASTIALSIQAE